MFDVGFSELIMIAIVALVVIGPERLPKVARTAGLLLGRMQRYVSDVKADINREMQLDELKTLRADLQDSARSFERSISSEIQSVEKIVDQTAQSAEQIVDPTAQSVEQLVDPTAQSVEPTSDAPALAAADALAAPGESDAVASDVAATPAAAERPAAHRLRRRIQHIRRREMNDA